MCICTFICVPTKKITPLVHVGVGGINALECVRTCMLAVRSLIGGSARGADDACPVIIHVDEPYGSVHTSFDGLEQTSSILLRTSKARLSSSLPMDPPIGLIVVRSIDPRLTVSTNRLLASTRQRGHQCRVSFHMWDARVAKSRRHALRLGGCPHNYTRLSIISPSLEHRARRADRKVSNHALSVYRDPDEIAKVLGAGLASQTYDTHHSSALDAIGACCELLIDTRGIVALVVVAKLHVDTDATEECSARCGRLDCSALIGAFDYEHSVRDRVGNAFRKGDLACQNVKSRTE